MGKTSANSDNSQSKNNIDTNQSNIASDWNRRAGPVFKYGLVVGFTLILLGGLSLHLSLTNVVLEILVVCSGLSIILGAFGSTAKVTIPGQSMVLVGVSAVAVALFLLLMQEMDDRYVHVLIEGDVKGSEIDFVGDQSYLGSFLESDRAFDFVVFGKEIKKPVLSLYITLPNETEVPFECIDTGNLRPYLGSGKKIVWRFDNDKRRLINVENRQRIAEPGPCKEEEDAIELIPSSENKPEPAFSFSLISSTYAQSRTQIDRADPGELIDQLESTASYLRRDARSQLAKQGIAVIQPLLNKLAEKPLSYRSKLGVVVALAEMMRTNKHSRSQAINTITEQDLVRLIDASIDEDRTIRIYASEFLYDLGDPRTIPISLARFASASLNGRYNLLLIIKGAVPFVRQEQKLKVARDVSKLKSSDTQKINALIDSIIALANIQ